MSMAAATWSGCLDSDPCRLAQQTETKIVKPMQLIAVAVLGLCMTVQPLAAADPGSPVSDDQLAVLMFVDQGRSFGYQTMMARVGRSRPRRSRLSRPRYGW